MQLSDLADYALQKYGLKPEYKWGCLPGWSVISNPVNGEWIALFVSRRNEQTGSIEELCDIKAGEELLEAIDAPGFGPGYCMHGSLWVGVRLTEETPSSLVFKLFDKAAAEVPASGCTIVLDAPSFSEVAAGQGKTQELPHADHAHQSIVYSDTPIPQDAPPSQGVGPDADGLRARRRAADAGLEKIRAMRRLYQYARSDAEHDAHNFVVQAAFMADYEDEAPTPENVQVYFPTYHKLDDEQLKGYFGWRTRIRRGIWERAPLSLAYLYVYELINGIGAESFNERVEKLKAFDDCYVRKGLADSRMELNLRRWMFELAVMGGLPPERIREFAPPSQERFDASAQVLSLRHVVTDAELFAAIAALAGSRFASGRTFCKDRERAVVLFSRAWHEGFETARGNGPRIFERVFGRRSTRLWRPLANAVFWPQKHPDAVVVLNDMRRYECVNGQWRVIAYFEDRLNKRAFRQFLREASRLIRLYLNVGPQLAPREEEMWATPFVEAAIAADAKARKEAQRPKVEIELSKLSRIREDADVTREKLLTQADLEDNGAFSSSQDGLAAREPLFDEGGGGARAAIEDAGSKSASGSILKESKGGDMANGSAAGASAPLAGDRQALVREVLVMLLRGEAPDALFSLRHLLPSVAADTINEALFEEVGDNVVDCDGAHLALVEDYREDIRRYLSND